LVLALALDLSGGWAFDLDLIRDLDLDSSSVSSSLYSGDSVLRLRREAAGRSRREEGVTAW
jgi:hypothetical protein